MWILFSLDLTKILSLTTIIALQLLTKKGIYMEFEQLLMRILEKR